MRITSRIFLALFVFATCLSFSLMLPEAGECAQVTLAWDKPNDSRVTGYNIYYGKSETDFKSKPALTIDSADQTSSVISGLENGQTYYFAATSIDAQGNQSDFSESITAVPGTTKSAVILSTSPKDGDTTTPVTANVRAVFSEAMSGNTFTENTFVVTTQSGGDIVDGTISFSDRTATFSPTTPFRYNTTYEVKMTTGIRDAANTALAQDYTWRFTTVANNPPDPPQSVGHENEEVVNATEVTLRSTPYNDLENNPIARSIWKIRKAGCDYDIEGYPASFSHEATSGEMTQHTVSELSNGMKYFWKVGYEDAESGIVSWSNEYSLKIGDVTKDETVTLPPAHNVAEGKMVCWPFWMDDPDALSVFLEEMGGSYDTTRFRIGAYDAQSGAYIEPDSGNLRIEPGQAVWLVAKEGITANIQGVPVSKLTDIDVKMKYNNNTGDGWNMIGPPNDANYYWADVQILAYDEQGNKIFGPAAIGDLPDDNPYIDKRLWRFENGAYVTDAIAVAQMEKNTGYWAMAKKENVYLRYGADLQVNRSNPKIMLSAAARKTGNWLEKWVFTPLAVAADNAPPPPIAAFTDSGASTGGNVSTSASGDGGGGGGCFISTAANGSAVQPHIELLRVFRDRFLLKHRVGRAFVNIYYQFSPPIADAVAHSEGLKGVVRAALIPLLGFTWITLKIGLWPLLLFAAFAVLAVGALKAASKKRVVMSVGK